MTMGPLRKAILDALRDELVRVQRDHMKEAGTGYYENVIERVATLELFISRLEKEGLGSACILSIKPEYRSDLPLRLD